MRCAPLAAALLLPVAAFAASTPSTGQVLEVDNYNAGAGVSYINAYQCGVATPTQMVKLAWSVVGGSTTGDNQIYASDHQPGTDGYCLPDAPSGSPVVHTTSVTSVPASQTTADVSGAAIAAAASRACDSTQESQAVWVCVQQVKDGNKVGYASGKFLIQVAIPGQPAITSVGSGDGELIVNFTPPADGDHYYAVATDPQGGLHWSPSVTGTSATISGLTNDVTYSVVVYAYSVGGNQGPASGAVSGTPMAAADFWDTYKNRGGVETGGCGSGAAGAPALLGALALLALRRRAP